MTFNPSSRKTKITDPQKKKVFDGLNSNKKKADIDKLGKIGDDIDSRLTTTENQIVTIEDSLLGKENLLPSKEGNALKFLRINATEDGFEYSEAGSSSNIKRHDFTSSYSYCGTAPTGSLESDSIWNIERIFVAANGTTTITSATGVAWIDRYTETYT